MRRDPHPSELAFEHDNEGDQRASTRICHRSAYMSPFILLLALTLSRPMLLSAQAAGRVSKPAAPAPVHVDINKATASDFSRLPGVGPGLARRIFAYRCKHGPFRRVEDLLAIRGIGPKKWRQIRPHLVITQAKDHRSN